jgi:hypothetical protein
VRLEGLGQLKNPMTASGIEATTRFFKPWMKATKDGGIFLKYVE